MGFKTVKKTVTQEVNTVVCTECGKEIVSTSNYHVQNDQWHHARTHVSAPSNHNGYIYVRNEHVVDAYNQLKCKDKQVRNPLQDGRFQKIAFAGEGWYISQEHHDYDGEAYDEYASVEAVIDEVKAKIRELAGDLRSMRNMVKLPAPT